MSNKLTPEEIRARFRVVCICMGIRAGKIGDAIKAGAITVQQVNRMVGSGAGECGATRCRPVIEDMLRQGGCPRVSAPAAETTELDDAFWFRTPVRRTR